MTTYSTAQKLSLAGMVMGALMCAVGGCAPYWLVLDPDGFGIGGNLFTKIVNGYMNAFVYCIELLSQTECRVIGINDATEWLLSVRVTVAANIVVGVLCGLCALCLACCSCCQRLIVPGIMAFLAAGSGAFGAVVFSRNTEVFTSSFLGYKLSSFGWAFYVFCAGVGVLGLVSFVACFASPEHHNAVGGMVVSQPPPPHVMVITPSAPQQDPAVPKHPHTAF